MIRVSCENAIPPAHPLLAAGLSGRPRTGASRESSLPFQGLARPGPARVREPPRRPGAGPPGGDRDARYADESGQPRARGLWSYSAIEPLFQDAIRRYGMVTTGYSLYGHSAGSQFVHRFLFHVPDAHVVRAVAANAGWYTMPDLQVEWPYGLRGSRVDSDKLASALNTPLTVLLGLTG